MKSLRKLQLTLVAAAGLVTLSATSTAATTETAGGACWSKAALAHLSDCPGNGPKTFDVGARGKQPRVGFKSAPQGVKLKKRDAKAKPGGPTKFDNKNLRDLREKALKPRVRALLITEIQGLESLFRTTPRRAADRPRIARRLAETYVELENAARRDKTMAEIKKNRKEAAKAKKIMLLARKKAIAYYKLIKRQYPSYKQLDEVLYYLAYEYEQADRLQEARKVYFELIKQTPNSKYIPSAYLAFGELFFSEAQSDPSKFLLAQQAYEHVTKYPPPDNKMWGYAHYKLAYVAWNQGNYAEALTHFKKTIEFGEKYGDLPNARPLAKAARKDLIPVYALAGKPKAAYKFFHALSGDKNGSNKQTFKMLDDLGQNYLDTGYYSEAIALYKDLMARDKGDKYCEYHAHIAEATMAMKSGNKSQIKRVLDEQVSVFKEFKDAKHSSESKHQCANATAGLLAETAMAWHLEAVGSGGVRGTNDPKTMALTDYLYGLVIDNFTADDFKTFKFPRIAKADWPTLYKIKYYRADLLYAQKKWDKCGPAFDAVVAENPKSKEAPEAAYSAVLCYQNIYDEMHKGGKDRKGAGLLPGSKKSKKKVSDAGRYAPKPFTDRQKGMLTAFNRYLCYIKPPKNDKEGWDQYVEVMYARARTYFEAQHWEEAAAAFREIAIKHPKHDAAIFAAQLYLESVNVLGDKLSPPRPSCFDHMAEDVPVFLKSFCTGAKAEANEDQCQILTRIQCDIQRLKAENLVKLADKGGANALQTYEQAAKSYLDLWKKYGKSAIEADKPFQCERLDEVVYNACRAYQAGHLVAKAIKCRTILLNPDNKLSDSPLARKAVYEIGGNYQAIAVYDKAANWYEKFAREKPKDKAALAFWKEKADTALSDAVVLRLGLGQPDKAIEDASIFKRYFGARKPARHAQISFAIASHYVEDKNWNDARAQLSRAMRVIDRSAAYDVRIQAHALLGRVYAKLNRDRNASIEYKKVTSLWKDPQKAQQKIFADAKGEDRASQERRLGKALTAVGEALFYFAEQFRHKTVDPIKFPEYKSNYKPTKGNLETMSSYQFQQEMEKRKKETEKVKKHINTKVKDWVTKKRKAIQEADKKYQEILHLQPTPPPRWVIAAGASVGQMWAGFVKDFRRAPIPGWMKQDDELRGVYYQNLDAASEPIKQLAKGAFKTCLLLSVKHQYFDKYSRTCEEWLADNYKAEFHKVDEFRARPDMVGSGLSDKPYPLDLGGTPHVPAPTATVPAKKKDDEK